MNSFSIRKCQLVEIYFQQNSGGNQAGSGQKPAWFLTSSLTQLLGSLPGRETRSLEALAPELTAPPQPVITRSLALGQPTRLLSQELGLSESLALSSVTSLTSTLRSPPIGKMGYPAPWLLGTLLFCENSDFFVVVLLGVIYINPCFLAVKREDWE